MIPYYDMKKHNEKYSKQMGQAIERVLKSGVMILGEEVSKFEKEFAEYLDVEHVAAVSTGVDAITLGLIASGIQPGDKVITTALTAYPTVCGIVHAGAIPVIVDISEDDMCIDPRCIERILRDDDTVKAVIPVHLYGHCCDMARIMKICSDYDVMVFEDCAQSHGCDYYGKKTGTFGIASAFSFYPTKNLGVCGEGGAVATHSKEVYDRVCELRNYGQREKYHHVINGYNCRLDEIKAAILREKLTYLDEWNIRRKEIAAIYCNKLSAIDQISIAETKDYCSHVHHIFAVRAERRDELRDFLKQQNILTEIHYPKACNEQQAFEVYRGAVVETPVASAAVKELLSLPMYPELEDEQVIHVCSGIQKFYESC